MAKRPTLSLGPKARGKAQANRQLMKSALTPNTLQAQAAPAPFKAQNDPFASSPKSKAIYKSTERGRSTLIEDYSEFAQATASKNGRLGFWADGEDIFAELSGSTESIHSDTYISSQTTPEQIVASRLQAAGPDVAAAFLESAQQALGLRGVSHTGFSKSTNPAEKLVYMAGQGQINLQDVAASLRNANREWGSPPPEDGDVHEPDFFDQYKEDERDHTPVSLKSPIDRALSVMGAMTVSHRRWKQQIDAPDLITPDLSTDLPTHMRSMHTEDKWSQKLFAANKAMQQLAQAYVDPSKIEGEELGATYESVLNRTAIVLSKLVPLKISDTGFAMATRGPGSAPVGWHEAMPDAGQVAKMMPKSDRGFIVDKVSKMWTEQDGDVTSPFTAAIKTIREVYDRNDEGGLDKPKDFGYRGKAYLIDQLVASGRADPEQTVLSQDPARDQMYEFRVTNEPNELYDDALRALGVTHADTIGDEELQAKVARTAIRLRTGGTGTEVSEVRNLVSPLWEKDADLPQARRGEQPFPIELRPETIFAPFKHTGQASSSTRNAPAPAEAPKVGDVIQTAAEAKAEAFQATGDPVAAREKYFSERPWLQAIADDDDKHDPMSLWQRSRRGRVTSSTAGELSDPEQTQSAMRRLVEGALTNPRKPVKLGEQSIWTRSGDALEPLALDWYSKHIDANVFSPGLIYNRNKPGQATTPDAIADGGRRIVEVKSRNAFLDPQKIDMTTRQGRQDAETLRKNYAQIQHQMYLTGARSADLVEILRDVENPNLPKGKGGLDASNIRTRRIDRDDEMIQRMTPQWEAAGKAADQIANLKPSQQKMFAKAVEEGNIASFEKLTKKYNIDGGAALAATLGMADEDSAGDGKSSSKGSGRNVRRAGGSGGGGGRDFGGNFAGFGGRDAPTELRGGTRGLLSAMGPMGRAVNVGLTAAEITWNTAQGLNDTGLNLSMSARSMGMSEKLFRDTRMDLASGRYVSLEAAQSDMSSIALAKGGMELGFVDRARQLVIGSRGALTIGDIQRADLNDPTTIRKLLGTMESRLKRRDVSDLGIAAAMEQTGLKSMASAADVEEGRRKLNDSVVQISDAILSMELFAGGALGDISENGVTLIKTVQQGFTDVLGVMRGDSSSMANLDEGRKSDGSTRDQRFGESKFTESGKPLLEEMASWSSGTSDEEMFQEYKQKTKGKTTTPAVNTETAKAIFEYMGEDAASWDMMTPEEREKFSGNLGTYSKKEQEKILETLRGSHSGTTSFVPSVMNGRMEVHLMTDGVAVITADDSGQVTSQSFKPYVQGQRQ